MADVFVHPIRIYWEDTDAGGIVFYANYLKFFERARTEWLRHLGLGQQHLRETTGGMFVVTHTSLHYFLPARLDDMIGVSAQLLEKGRASLRLVQQASRQDGSTTSLLCEGSIRIGWVDAARLRPARIPKTLLDLLP
ncbi:MAG: tol-pal system-associated acyl-CoA thioesterase [Betaproteobacteria bacterium]|nr:tol-pal system-associated acyl-CoA thioesterase [Betaproteobacteria bacterium]NBY05099.1 tol-pal system-associated acyl-CoA thioesterase [Betaproteobacteria bacterium]